MRAGLCEMLLYDQLTNPNSPLIDRITLVAPQAYSTLHLRYSSSRTSLLVFVAASLIAAVPAMEGMFLGTAGKQVSMGKRVLLILSTVDFFELGFCEATDAIEG